VSLRFGVAARRELFRAADQYDRKLAGLGDRFLNEVTTTLRFIKDYPKARPDAAGGIWLWPMRRFPYGVLYILEADTIIILAIGHLHRGPTYWRRVRRRERKTVA
jgi:hypothetical protein